ncbi:MAG: hypothetical protein HYX71_06690 [Opitutae bacterium]|nr:hypothetical protein [Opitutae bacterium]
MKLLHRILLLLLVVTLPMRAAVNRVVRIEAPAEVVAGSTVEVTLIARTDAGDGEQIGFLHAEYSIDEGRTWAQFCIAENCGAEVFRKASFAVSAKGGKAIVRVRAAFRGGVAGDVDYRGGAIQWSDSWQKWRWPPAKYAVVNVTAVNRAISIEVPAEVAPGGAVSVTVHASTDASDGEQIGFLHADYSIDGGKTWTQFCYTEKSGAKLSRQTVFAANAKGGKAIVRVRAAFRGGGAGDVDCKGGAIQWNDSWQKWRSPAAKYAIIQVSNSLVAAPMRAAMNRAVSIDAPAEASAGSTVSVTVHASTDATDGEQIGIVHADYSVDEGLSWTQCYYAELCGAELSRQVSFAVNAKGGKAIVRVRVAFRGGGVGDVDYKGGAIQWNDSWQKWRSPPTKYAIVYSPRS